jgi:hypothetical protein
MPSHRASSFLATADSAWDRVLVALSANLDTQATGAASIIVVNPGPVDRSDIVEVPWASAGPLHASADGVSFPAQMTADGRGAFVAAAVPAFGWRTFALESGSISGAVASVEADAASLSTGALDARLVRRADGWALQSVAVAGRELLAGDSLEWVVYSDTGGLYRIGSERADCVSDGFTEVSTVRLGALELVESGPARVTLRASTVLDGMPTVLDLVAADGSDRLIVRVTGAAARDRTVMLRVRPGGAGDHLTMGVAGGTAVRPLAHLYSPSLWPAVTSVTSGSLTVALAQSTGVYGNPDGALGWVVFRNATSEDPCDNLGPMGTDDDPLTAEFSLGAADAATGGAGDLAASISLTRPMHAVSTEAHSGNLPPSARLLSMTATSAIATVLKPANRGRGFLVHFQRFGSSPTEITFGHGILEWSTVTRPDLLERDDKPVGVSAGGEVSVTLESALTAFRLSDGM